MVTTGLWILLCVYLLFAEFLDTIGRLDIIEKRWPRIWRMMSNRPFRLILLLFLFGLVAKDVSERWSEKETPKLNVVMPAPPAPIVQFVQAAPKGPQTGMGIANNPGVIKAPITQGPCGVIQNGGSNNTASPTCGPPPLVLEARLIAVAEHHFFDDKPGFIKTEILISPNEPVGPPFTIALEFDKPISSVGHTVANVGAQMGGGPFTVGIHVRETVLTGISPSHPLVVVVFSDVPVRLVAQPTIQL